MTYLSDQTFPKIEKGISPANKTVAMQRAEFLKTMEVNDSFEIEHKDSSKWHHEIYDPNTGMTFIKRNQPNGKVRIWRTH